MGKLFELIYDLLQAREYPIAQVPPSIIKTACPVCNALLAAHSDAMDKGESGDKEYQAYADHEATHQI
jgi:hypothetical protein